MSWGNEGIDGEVPFVMYEAGGGVKLVIKNHSGHFLLGQNEAVTQLCHRARGDSGDGARFPHTALRELTQPRRLPRAGRQRVDGKARNRSIPERAVKP